MGPLGFFRLQFGLLTWKGEFQSLTMRLHVTGYWKRSIIPTGISIGSYMILIGSYPGSWWDPAQDPDRILPRTLLNCRNWLFSTWNVVQVPPQRLPIVSFMIPMSLWVSVKYILFCNSSVFSCIESIFRMEVLWEDRHQQHTSLPSYHGNHSDISITLLSWAILSPSLVWEFFQTMGIRHRPCCYSN